MNSQKLYKLLLGFIDSSKCFPAGVFPQDHIPTTFSRYPACFIANTDPSHKPGEHWVAYYFHGPNDYEFFDSYGFHPSIYAFSLSSPSLYNKYTFQSFNSNYCGQYCLYYLNSKSLGATLDSISHSLSLSNSRWNDKFVHRFAQRISNPSVYFSKGSTFPIQISQKFIVFKRKSIK